MRRIPTQSPQELVTRTCTRPCKDTQGISLRTSDLHKIMQRPLTALRKDPHKLFPKGPAQDRARTPDRISPWSLQDPRVAQGIVKDLDQDLHARTRMSQGHHNRTCWCWRGSNKIEMQEPHKSIPDFIQAAIYSSTRNAHGQPQSRSTAQPVRACTVKMHMDISEGREFTMKMPRAKTVLCEPAQWKCTWTSQKGTFMREFTEWKCRSANEPWPRSLACASLRSGNAHLTGELLCENSLKKRAPENPGLQPLP